MNDILHQAIYRFASLGDYGTAPPAYERVYGSPSAPVLVSLNPSNSVKRDFARQGYAKARVFFALPSLNAPRWLFPLGRCRCTLEGLQIYKPYKRRARILKALLTTMVTAHCQGFAPNQVLVASREILPLETLVREVTREYQPVFSLLVGTEAHFRKLTVQVMRPDGDILGYIKLPLTDAAVERVRHEAETLNHLWRFPALRPYIPQVLYSGEWGNGPILFQSGGPSRPGPQQFNSQCEEFLRLLLAIHSIEKPGHFLWEEVAARWCRTELNLASGWRDLGWAVIKKAKQELDGVLVRYGTTHGDFAPWNTRVADGRLYVFDWEYASWEAPTSWDIFHFKTQAAALLNKKDNRQIFPDRGPSERASYLLYLLNSACKLFGEESPARAIGLEYRRQLLASQVGGF